MRLPEASTISIDHFPALLARLPLNLDLEGGSGGHSLQRVAAWAGEQGIAALTEEALIQRLHGAGPFLVAVIGQLLARVVACIKAVCDEFECYRYRRVSAALRDQGVVVNNKKLRRLMKEHDLQPKRRRRYVVTTDTRSPAHTAPTAPTWPRNTAAWPLDAAN